MARQKIRSYDYANHPYARVREALIADPNAIFAAATRAAAGLARWTHMTRARIDSSPAIAGGRVYVGSNDGRLYALDLASGKVVWEHDEGAALSASPALAAGRIVIGSTDGRLLCFA